MPAFSRRTYLMGVITKRLPISEGRLQIQSREATSSLQKIQKHRQNLDKQ